MNWATVVLPAVVTDGPVYVGRAASLLSEQVEAVPFGDHGTVRCAKVGANLAYEIRLEPGWAASAAPERVACAPSEGGLIVALEAQPNILMEEPGLLTVLVPKRGDAWVASSAGGLENLPWQELGDAGRFRCSGSDGTARVEVQLDPGYRFASAPKRLACADGTLALRLQRRE